MELLAVGGLAMLLSAGLIKLVFLSPEISARLTHSPTANRWHSRPTPSLGGVPMFIAVAVSVLAAGGWSHTSVRGLLAGAAILTLVGVIDDTRDIRPIAKLAGQTTAALVFVAFADGGMTLVVAVLVVPWIILIANSVNLLDNMDGLAAGTSAGTLLVLLPVLLAAEQTDLTLFVVATVGAIFGFLVFNWNPARIFMGDAGSLWLGMVLAATLVLVDYGQRPMVPLVIVTILAVPLLDTSIVIISRLGNGRSIMQGGRDHVSHRLVRRGLSDARAVQVLIVVSVLCALVGLAGGAVPTAYWLVMEGVLWAGLMAAAVLLLRQPVYGASKSNEAIVSPGGDTA